LLLPQFFKAFLLQGFFFPKSVELLLRVVVSALGRGILLVVTGSDLRVEDLPVLADLQAGLSLHADVEVTAVLGGGIPGVAVLGKVHLGVFRAGEAEEIFNVAVRRVFGVLASVGEGGEGEALGTRYLEGASVDAVEEVATVVARARAKVAVCAKAACRSLGWLKFVPGATVRFDGVDARVATVGDGVLEDETVRALLLGGLAVLALGIAVAVLIVGVVVHVLWGALLTVCDGDAEGDE